MDAVLAASDGRQLGVAEFGEPSGTAVLWCHGGPGSRLEPMWLDEAAAAVSLRLIGLDRPGYGRSTPAPGRTILDVVDDMLSIADQLSLEQFCTVGISTGGVYAIATAAVAPDRVLGVLACCSMTDMSWPPGRATMSPAHTHAVWDAPDRDAAIAAAVAAHGVGGSKMLDGGLDAVLAESDRLLFANRSWMGPAMIGFEQNFTFGFEGYADDRLADGPGWTGFDVADVRCPVTVLHGSEDGLVDAIHAQHTTEIVPGAELVLVPGLGHFSIETRIIPELSRLLGG
jgi:pimeloyl-ACP methyl ester carboxylesterase